MTLHLNRALTDRLRGKRSLCDTYHAVRRHTEMICQPLETEDFVVQPAVDISPPKWHLAHTTWFWEEFILVPYLADYTRFHPSYAFLFNSYYNHFGERVLRMDRGNMSRPTVKEIFAYRRYVDDHMEKLFHAGSLSEGVSNLVEIGVNHEQQHQELLLADIKYILGHNPLFPVYDSGFSETPRPYLGKEFIEVAGGKYTIGYVGDGFSYDNEHGVHEVVLQDFSIRNNLVTNAEYLAFMEDGGYRNYNLWHSDAWAWVNENDIRCPLYWHYINGKWKRYSMNGLKDVKPDDPVTHVSFYEAFAFAEWTGMRLPTEFEWEAASEQFSWGQRWEHTSSAYLPYPGYRKPEGAVGEYNGKFMINQMVLRGASVATPAGHSRKTYRNFFAPNLRWQFNGIRLCKK